MNTPSLEPTEYFMLVLFVFLGAFSLVAAIFNFEWYFKTQGAQTIIKWFGVMGARIFYALLGIILMTFGLGLLFL